MAMRVAPILVLVTWGCTDAHEDAPIPPTGCGPGTTTLDDGSCQAAGVVGCAPGFEADQARGCTPVLPPPCAEGTMALPGESSCHEVAPCGDGPWGDAPSRNDTQYVDASYANADSDGSAARPWKTLRDAFVAASPNAVIALARGSYQADFDFTDKPVRIWGHCPANVTIDNPDPQFAAVQILAGMEGSELRRVALTGMGPGVLVAGSEDVLIDSVWVHDTAGIGIRITYDFGPAAARIAGSLVERATEKGIHVEGVSAEIDGTVVRDTVPRASDGGLGYGIAILDNLDGARANATIRQAVIERNHDVGVLVAGADAAIEAIVAQDQLPHSSMGTGGNGIVVQNDPDTGQRGSLLLGGSVIRRCLAAGIAVEGSDATIEDTTVIDTAAQAADGLLGRGLGIQDQLATGVRTNAVVRTSVLRNSQEGGAVVIRSDVELEATAILGSRWDGLAVDAGDTAASASLTHGHVAGSERAGITSFGALVRVAGTALECNLIQLDGESLYGLTAIIEDVGGNACGCMRESTSCKVLSSNLTAPVALP
jgi:hypothetical protein